MQNLELTLFLFAACVTSGLLYLAARPAGKQALAFLLLPVVCLVVSVFWIPPDTHRKQLAAEIPRIRQDEYVSSSSCRSCHAAQYQSWHHSFHRTMTQIASEQSVLAPFDGRELNLYGDSCRVEKQGDMFVVEMPDPDWEASAFPDGIPKGLVSDAPRVRLPVVMTTGSHHLQAYWVPSEHGNKLRIFPWVFHIGMQRWMPNEDSFISPPDMKHYPQIWNNSCILCHSLAGEDGYDPGDWKSSVAELGISCEACHGPGEKHVERHTNPITRYASRLTDQADDTIVNPARMPPDKASQVCAQCHTAFDPNASAPKNVFRPGADFENIFTLANPHREPTFWPDGTMRIGGREYSGMIESECFSKGDMSCLSCHAMHASDPNKQLRTDLQADDACTQCHQDVGENVAAHTHHSAESVGSRCYNCHMPYSSYALFSAIRSHRVDSPNVRMSTEGGRPNACNQCHLDQTLAWTSEHLHEWYGIQPVAMREDEKNLAASLLWMLRGDAVQRVLAAWTFAWEPANSASSQGATGSEWQVPFLVELLDDPYTMVRYMAARALSHHGKDLAGYDFLIPPTQRSPAAPGLQRLLRPAGEPKIGAAAHGLKPFFDENGNLTRDVLERLISERDNTPLTLNE